MPLSWKTPDIQYIHALADGCQEPRIELSILDSVCMLMLAFDFQLVISLV